MNKKGCGKMFGGKNNHDWCCGDFLEEDEITGKGNYYYCPECQEKNQSQDVAVAKNDRYQRDSGYEKKSICHPDTQSHPSQRDGGETDDKENSYENFRSLSSGSDTQIPHGVTSEYASTNELAGSNPAEETEMSGSLDSNSGTLNPNVSGFLSKEIKEVEKGCGIKKVNGICGERLGGI